MKKLLTKLYVLIMYLPVYFKWRKDKFHLSLSNEQWHLYLRLHVHYFLHLRSFPDLVATKDFNDKIQWLKLFDQSHDKRRLCDKQMLKDYVGCRLGENYVPKTIAVVNDPDDINVEDLPERFVIKTTHDSGGVKVLSKSEFVENRVFLAKFFRKKLSVKYGYGTGEWCYLYVKPRLIVEEYVNFSVNSSSDDYPPDYKFHCSDGKVIFLQFIYNRRLKPTEVIVDPNGKETGIWFDRNMRKGREFLLPDCWAEMVTIAEELSRGFKYVRVDVYNGPDRPLVGEMTFYPLAGVYSGSGQKKLGKLLQFDKSFTCSPVDCNGFR